MIKVIYTSELPYPTVCYGCGKKNDDRGVRIEARNPTRIRGNVLYLCDKCHRELWEKL